MVTVVSISQADDISLLLLLLLLYAVVCSEAVGIKIRKHFIVNLLVYVCVCVRMGVCILWKRERGREGGGGGEISMHRSHWLLVTQCQHVPLVYNASFTEWSLLTGLTVE